MRSRAHIKSHPIHPILVALPIGFFIGSFAFDLLHVVTENTSFAETGLYLVVAGIVSALVAAVPGAIDYFLVVPPASSAKKRATKHALLNLGNVILFFAVFLYRFNYDANPYVVVAAEALGIGILSMAGWMGGTLVHRNQIGIDHRYANAGKWNEQTIDADGDIVEVAREGEIRTNAMKLVHVRGLRIVIANTGEGYLAFDDHCTHRGASLADGAFICGTVQCPWHGSQFDAATGAVLHGPAKSAITTYRLEVDGKRILLHL
ncbi:MAG TPA: DUF2231 domain-containing protein [Flavisolibacter sp.]